MTPDVDTGLMADVDPADREDVDWLALDAEGGDDSTVEEMLAAMQADAGTVMSAEVLL